MKLFAKRSYLYKSQLLYMQLASLVSWTLAKSNPEEFDFVIVGGGTAGSVVASRISENGKHSVLLLEAGEVSPPDLDVPALAPTLLVGEQPFIKRYASVKQENAFLANNGIIGYVAGRALGGTSSINAMIWNRGSPYDYDEWAFIAGDERWNYENMLKYHKKVENYGGNFPSGFTPVETNKKIGRRVSSYKTYLEPYITSKKNLKVITGVWANKIEFEGNKAVGVRYTTTLSKVEQHFVRARFEIIVSAGVIESPALLMRSGVGPNDVLEETSIPAVKHLPVGKNLQDHTVVQLSFIINDTSKVVDFKEALTPESYQVFQETGEGPYSSYGGAAAQAFFPSSVTTNKNWSDIALLQLSSAGLARYATTALQAEMAANERKSTVIVYLSRPKSRGRLILNTTNIHGDPIIDFRYLTHPDDVQVLVEGIQKALQIYERTEPFQKIGARYAKPLVPLPACQQHTYRSDDYWSCFVKQFAITGLHGVGTCSMGKEIGDQEAVVDSTLKVIGIRGLRVVDASVIPKITNANVQAPVFALAEKAADMILEEWDTFQSKSEL